jgi:RNA polymerase sigma-70 factor (ECF subfamily)
MHEDLLRRLRAGRDPEALARLFELDQAGIYHFMRRRLGHRQDAEDATQEVFRRVILSLPSLRDLKAYRGWLYHIALRVAQSQIHARVDDRHRVESMARTTAATGTIAMDDSASEDRRARVKSAVDSLEEELRTVVLLRYEQGLSYEEIAEATQRPMGTVSKRLHTAHQKLQQTLAAVGISLVAGALEASALEAVPERLAGRLRQMALEATLRPAPVPTAKAGAIAAAGILAILFLGTPLLRRMSADAPPVSASPPAAEASGRTSASTATTAASAPVPKETPASSPAEVRPAAPAALVRGRVIDRETRAAIGGAEVWLEPGGEGPEKAIRTSAAPDGSFSLRVPAGSYRLDAIAPGFARYQTERMLEAQRVEALAEEEPEGKAAADAVWKCFRLDLTAGSELERTIDLTGSAEIRGLVVDRQGHPVPGARVSLDFLSIGFSSRTTQFHFDTKYDPDGRISTFVTDLQGRFAMRNVYAEGSLKLSVACAGFRGLDEVVRHRRGDQEITLVLDRGVSYGG